MLGLESSSGRMNNIARQEIYYGRYYSPKDIIQSINSITLDQIKNLAERLVQREYFSVTIYGPVREGDIKGILDAEHS
jgi:predicted Zn-dependent peptidase